MRDKKKIKNRGIIAFISACILVATGMLDYSIGRSQDRTYSMVEQKETTENTKNKEGEQIEKEENIKGGITLEEAKKIAVDYHIHPVTGQIISYSIDDSGAGTTDEERIHEKVICDAANRPGYAPED